MIALLGTLFVFLYKFEIFKKGLFKYLPVITSLFLWIWGVYLNISIEKSSVFSSFNIFTLSISFWFLVSLINKRRLSAMSFKVLLFHLGILLYDQSLISFLELFYFIFLIRLDTSEIKELSGLSNYAGSILMFTIIMMANSYLGSVEVFDQLSTITSNYELIQIINLCFISTFIIVLLQLIKSLESLVLTGGRASWLEVVSGFLYLNILQKNLFAISIFLNAIILSVSLMYFLFNRKKRHNVTVIIGTVLLLNMPEPAVFSMVFVAMVSPWCSSSRFKELIEEYRSSILVLVTFSLPLIIQISIKKNATKIEGISLTCFMIIFFMRYVFTAFKSRLEGVRP